MVAYGAELISVPAGKMEMARDLAAEMAARGEGIVLDQSGNLDNPLAHYRGTGAVDREGYNYRKDITRCCPNMHGCAIFNIGVGGTWITRCCTTGAQVRLAFEIRFRKAVNVDVTSQGHVRC